MKWLEPTKNAERHVTRFLLIPTTLNNETRWLEIATIFQRAKEIRIKTISGEVIDYVWQDITFA